MLEEKLKEYLEQAEVVKTLNRDLRELKKEHELYPQIEELKKQLKDLREKLRSTTEIALVKEKRDGARERKNLLKDILLGEMAEQGETEVVANGKKARIISKVKFEKSKA
jgi:16S rRNA G1207 methylase RsmC